MRTKHPARKGQGTRCPSANLNRSQAIPQSGSIGYEKRVLARGRMVFLGHDREGEVTGGSDGDRGQNHQRDRSKRNAQKKG